MSEHAGCLIIGGIVGLHPLVVFCVKFSPHGADRLGDSHGQRGRRSGVIRRRADDRRRPCDLMRLKKPC